MQQRLAKALSFSAERYGCRRAAHDELAFSIDDTQARLLATLWPLLRPGGRMLYCTCSVFKAEGEQQITAFVAHNTDAVLRPAPGHLLPQTVRKGSTVPDNQAGDHDGFYYALLEKQPPPAPRP